MVVPILIIDVIIAIAAVVVIVIATIILSVKGNQQADPSEKTTLRVAGAFAGLSILFIFLTLGAIFPLLAARGCKKTSIGVIIISILAVSSLIIPLVISQIFAKRFEERGDPDGARDLRAAFGLIIAGLILAVIGFTIFMLFIGRKFKGIGKTCRQLKKAKSSVGL